jgi:hypothetical protein
MVSLSKHGCPIIPNAFGTGMTNKLMRICEYYFETLNNLQRSGVFFWLLIILVFSINACNGGTMQENDTVGDMKAVPESQWKGLSEKKIYFGHMSVGFNIIEGIKDVMKENPRIQLHLTETRDPAEFDKPVFAHSRIGENHDPISKIDALKEYLKNGIGRKADIVFLKFCFVDIVSGTDIQEVFSYYRDSIKEVKSIYPDVTFVHVTVPLTAVQSGPKAWIKKLIGKPVDGYADNIKRNEFNALMKKEYLGKEPLFDLAHIESSSFGGSNGRFTSGGRTYEAMNPVFTHDRGHLNSTGRKIVAQNLLMFLAGLTMGNSL